RAVHWTRTAHPGALMAADSAHLALGVYPHRRRRNHLGRDLVVRLPRTARQGRCQPGRNRPHRLRRGTCRRRKRREEGSESEAQVVLRQGRAAEAAAVWHLPRPILSDLGAVVLPYLVPRPTSSTTGEGTISHLASWHRCRSSPPSLVSCSPDGFRTLWSRKGCHWAPPGSCRSSSVWR